MSTRIVLVGFVTWLAAYRTPWVMSVPPPILISSSNSRGSSTYPVKSITDVSKVIKLTLNVFTPARIPAVMAANTVEGSIDPETSTSTIMCHGETFRSGARKIGVTGMICGRLFTITVCFRLLRTVAGRSSRGDFRRDGFVFAMPPRAGLSWDANSFESSDTILLTRGRNCRSRLSGRAPFRLSTVVRSSTDGRTLSASRLVITSLRPMSAALPKISCNWSAPKRAVISSCHCRTPNWLGPLPAA